MPSDERGQMMLLAAIVLLIAFLSMAVMIARVTLVASETSRDQHGAFLREASAAIVAIGIIEGETDDYNAYLALVQDLQAFEAQRGFLLSWECNGALDTDLDYFRLTDGRSTVIYGTVGPVNPGDDCAA